MYIMTKTKFTLTTDLVKVEPEPDISEDISKMAVVNIPNTKNAKETEKQTLKIKIPKRLKKEFQLWCITNGKTMTEALEEAMENLIKG